MAENIVVAIKVQLKRKGAPEEQTFVLTEKPISLSKYTVENLMSLSLRLVSAEGGSDAKVKKLRTRQES